MKKFLLILLSLYSINYAYSQDFSNKGKDFWVGYGYHQIFNAGNQQNMVLYFATDQVTTVKVTIPGIGWTRTYTNIPANTVFTSDIIPKGTPIPAEDARLLNESTFPENKGIHIESDKSVVAYAHIYNGNVSGATILYPTNTLGKEYYSVNYTNNSNSQNANCWFYVIACDTGTTTVEITPSANTLNHAAGVPFTINLTQGQIYNLMGTISGSQGVDLTGSKIKSIASGTSSCKRIGVFSGSGRIAISCNGSAPSSDNYMVQSLPKTAWGKKYLTTASAGYQSALPLTPNIYRICVTDPTTLVSVNGIPVAVPLQSNFYYELPATTETQLIEADKPIMVAQYFPSQTACGAAANDGDPEVIYLSPVEQSINSVRWNACRNNSINSGKHYINVIIPNTGTAISSFKLDGVTVPATSFTVFPQDPAFSYIILNVAGSNVPPGVAHAVTSDSGFNAIAYGYGQFESYGYNAGTNIRDLYNFLSPINPYSIALDPVACTGSPFYFSVTFPFQPTSIAWDFHLNPNQSPNANVVQNAPVSDSTYLIGTKRVWRYKLPGLYTYNLANSAPGYTVSISAGTTDPEGCGNTFERDFILAIYDPPVAKMDWFNNGCVTDSVRFRDTTVYLAGTYSYKWYWNFGDGKTDSVRYPVHKYTTPGTYTVKFAMISNVGCFSDTAIKTITVTNVPTVGFTHSTPVCVGSSISFTSNAAASPPGNLQKWFWDFGDGTTQTLVAPASGNITHTYTAWGNQNANLRVETNSGCKSIIDTNVIYVNPIPFVNFNLPGGLCLPSDTARFFDASSIADGSQASFQYLWNFGDPPSGALNTSIIKDPVHYYNSGGPFTIKLQIKSSGGCVKDTTKLLTTVYPRPLSGFTVQSEYCLNAASSFTSSSVGSGSPITNWYWDFGDGTPVVNATLATATHTYTTTGIKTIKHWIKTDKGCISDTTVKTVTINSLPDASFTTNAPYCKGVNITFTNTSVANSGNIVLWNWNLGDATILNLNNGNPFTHAYATPGVKTVTLKVTTDKGCVSTVFSTTITINPTPVTKFTHLQACLPSESVAFTNTTTVANGSALTYTWNFGDPSSGAINNTSVLTSPSHYYAAPGNYNVTLTATSADGCIKDSMITISDIYAQPRASFTVDPENCLNTETIFTSTSTGSGATITNWYWDFGDGSAVNTTQNPTYTYLTANTFTVKHWVKTINNCYSDTVTHTVTVNPLPTANFNFTTPTCASKLVNFTDASVPNAGTLSEWSWNFGDLPSGAQNTSTLRNPTHTYTSAGLYTVTLTVKTNKGCVSATYTNPNIVVNPRPDAGFISPEVCLDDTYAQFTDTSTVAGLPLGAGSSWSWNFDDPASGALNTSTLQNPQHSYNTIGTKNVTLIVTSPSGCKDTLIQSFFVNGDIPLAGLTVNNETSLCANDTVSIVNTSTVNVGSVVKVEIYWDNVNAPTVFETDNDPSPNERYTHLYPNLQVDMTYQIRFRAYSGTICIDDKFKTIVVHAAPKVRFLPIPDTCLNIAPFQITQATELGGVPGSYVFTGPGVSPTGIFDPASVGPGTYTIRYYYTSTQGCVDSAKRTIKILVPPVANFGFSAPACETQTVTFTDSSSAPVGALTTWTWDFGDGTAPVVRNTSAAFTHTFALAGPYTVSLTVTTNKGCNSSVKQRNILVAPLPRASFRFTDTACLPNAIIRFTNQSSIADGSQNSFIYTWNFGDPANGTINNTSSALNPSHIYTGVGPYTVKLFVKSAAGCVDDTTIILNTIHPQPKADFDFNKPSVCLGDFVTFIDQSNTQDGTFNEWYWDFGDGNSSTVQNPQHTYADTGTYIINQYIVNSFGCNSDTLPRSFTVYPYPVVSAGPDKTVLEGYGVLLEATATGNDLQYKWTRDGNLSNNLFLNNDRILRPTSTPVNDMKYLLTVTARGGCPVSDQVLVKVLKIPSIPNTFTPNNDQYNNTWKIKYLDDYPHAKVQVFTRTGQMVFEARNGYTKPWDGTFNGKPLPVDTYYYIIEPESGRKPITGYVTIIK